MPPSRDEDDSDALSDFEVEAILGGKREGKAVTLEDRRTIVQSSFDAYFALSAAKVSTSSNLFSALIQPLSAEEYAESVTVDSLGAKHLQSSILLEPARSALFSRLLCELNEGFNLICYGFGSKRNLLNQFAIRGITSLTLTSCTADSQARRIYDFFSQSPKQRHLYLVVHNIDSFTVRTPKAKSCLSLLALHPHIHLVAPVDYVKSPLLWSSSEASARKEGFVPQGRTAPRGFTRTSTHRLRRPHQLSASLLVLPYTKSRNKFVTDSHQTEFPPHESADPMRYSTIGFSEEQLAVLAVAETFLGGIGARDKNLMLAQILPLGGATLLRNGSPICTTLTGVVERIPFDDPRELSEIISAQPTILVDRDLAMAWTPYEFLIDNVIDHVGTDIWGFAKQDGRWFISTLADNSHKPE
ncbi:origin recognition complex subunit 2-domain-containing protein [Mycena vulgaris]|nr:origin recognition complex subunit 2-domain-containing protein [Mycena vulgaris]